MAEHLLVCERGGKGARAVFIHEIRIRSAKSALRRGSRSSILAPGPERARLRDLWATIVLGPARPKFACRIKTAHCKQQWNLQRPGNFVCETSDEAPRMTANDNERQ
jgi:hypothetical protein